MVLVVGLVIVVVIVVSVIGGGDSDGSRWQEGRKEKKKGALLEWQVCVTCVVIGAQQKKKWLRLCNYYLLL